MLLIFWFRFLKLLEFFWYNCKMGLALILVGYKVHIHLSSLCCQMKSDYMHFFEISWYFINVHNSAIKGGLVNIQIVIVSQQFYFQHSSIKIKFFLPMKLHYEGRSCTGKNWLTKIGLRNNIHQKRKISCSLIWNPTIFNIIRCVAGTNESSTKRLMFQVLFFFIISCKTLCENCFNLSCYFL